jgi:hypothetical protein
MDKKLDGPTKQLQFIFREIQNNGHSHVAQEKIKSANKKNRWTWSGLTVWRRSKNSTKDQK